MAAAPDGRVARLGRPGPLDLVLVSGSHLQGAIR